MRSTKDFVFQTFRKLYFSFIPLAIQRTHFIYRNRKLFQGIGKDLFFQPRIFPDQPELISIGNNVKIASGVTFVNHDIIHCMLNDKFGEHNFEPYSAPIKIDDNVMIGANAMIMPGVHICSDVIVAAGSVVTKDITLSGVWGGVPARRIKSFEEFVEKRRNQGE